MIQYVLPVPRELRGALLDYSRLYALPAEPEPPPASGFIILDSGAFALAQRGKSITTAHMKRLAAHYRRFAGERVWCCAPDAYLDPAATMRNWRFWRACDYPDVFPVIQFPRARTVDLYAVHKQVEYYRPFAPAFIAVSNNVFCAIEARAAGFRHVFDLIRAALPGVWIHVFGAGWDLHDIRAWSDLGGFDSMDSIAYYTTAQAGQTWGETGANWRETAILNAQAAQRCLTPDWSIGIAPGDDEEFDRNACQNS